ncbi:MAG: Ig-like domain-containing protein, partial [Gemmatimonadaceae bacterium]
MRATKLLLVATAAVILAVATSCTEVVAPKEATTLALSDDALELVPGAAEQLNATPKDASGTPLTRPLAWSTSAPSIATVASGLVTGVAPGTAVITVTAGGLSNEALVTVRDGGLLGPAGAHITGLGGRVTIEVRSSSVSKVLKLIISSAGSLVANSRLLPGTAIELKYASPLSQAAELTIRYDSSRVALGRAASLRLYEWVAESWNEISGSVVDIASSSVRGSITQSGIYGVLTQLPIERVSVAPTTASLRVRQQSTFTTSVEDADGRPLQRRVTWSTSAAAIVTVDSLTGVATARAPGTAMVSATAEGVSASASVTVSAGPAADVAVKDGDNQSVAVSAS